LTLNSKHVQHIKIYLLYNFEVNLNTQFGVIAFFSSNFQCRQFEINTLLNEEEMLTFVDFFYLKREAVESKKGCAISKK
jgi:hypothetical protein